MYSVNERDIYDNWFYLRIRLFYSDYYEQILRFILSNRLWANHNSSIHWSYPVWILLISKRTSRSARLDHFQLLARRHYERPRRSMDLRILWILLSLWCSVHEFARSYKLIWLEWSRRRIYRSANYWVRYISHMVTFFKCHFLFLEFMFFSRLGRKTQISR